ncbi:MAG: cysteine-rich small domain-containing protein [Alphaproteobacteria bacterium]|uniref:Cysteine-rich small domain-containing protein n=1 Tax=Candidatus Nitrobium versatile TaxID=2884831 RepID=A0A953JEF1_9BACT|nr:cysteine-rich small domain-containing protein [Candidatus Nitrobium versatile]
MREALVIIQREEKALKKTNRDTSEFFSNHTCKYFPCHETDSTQFNCIFCYCPMYFVRNCLGRPRFITSDNKTVKDCSGCDYPHRPENYRKIIGYLIEVIKAGETVAVYREN